jgi:hypothetical protein
MQPCGMLALLQMHMLRRIYETTLVTRFSATRREHPLTLCVGAFFYILLSPSLALEVHVARLLAEEHPSTASSLLPEALCILTFACANVAQHLA